MKNLWSDKDARACVRRYKKQGVNADLALRVYTSRLLGGEPGLVLHGGGNTSVKTTVPDQLGEPVEVLCVKGSGWDMADIEPACLPAIRLEPLRRLAELKTLSDEDMVNAQRANLLDTFAPNPSLETLLHAFVANKFIDHTHANAILALTNQPRGEALCRDALGPSIAVIPYVKSGFGLAKAAVKALAADPGVHGLVVVRHGIFTFGDTAKQAYGRMIRAVNRAEKRLRAGRDAKGFAQVRLPARIAPAAEVAPILRGLTAHDGRPMFLNFRTSKAVREFAGGRQAARYAGQGPATPDHVIRTKPKPLLVPAPEAGRLDAFRAGAERALGAYVGHYRAYFKRHNARSHPKKIELDPMPRVVLVPGLGLFGLGPSVKEAVIAADLAEANVDIVTAAEAMGRYRAVAENDLFDIEYWSLEQAKLGQTAEKPLARTVVAVTGGGSGIGAATARAFAEQGAAVAVLDRDRRAAGRVAAEIGGLGLGCDVTDEASVRSSLDATAARFGGLDVVVSNAGAAWQGRIGEVADKVLRDSFELNFWGHQNVARHAVRVMRAQGLGGCLLFNTSKQAVNPGKDFGPYGLPKAATLFLMRQYALDYGADGIRSNAVNADRIRSGLLTGKMISSRSKARGLSEADYMAGNLLGTEVTADDVARAFVHLALSPATTAAVLTVDGGNIAAALR